MTYKRTLWDPDEGDEDGELKVEAMTAFQKPVTVPTTKAVVRRLVQRMRADKTESVKELSNAVFRRSVVADVETMEARSRAKDATEDEKEAWGRFCGDVIVFYATRVVLDGRAVPVV